MQEVLKHGIKLHYLKRQYGAYLKFIRMGGIRFRNNLRIDISILLPRLPYFVLCSGKTDDKQILIGVDSG